MPKRKYSTDLVQKDVALRERGLTFGQIARKTGMSSSAVSWYCLREGAESPRVVLRPRVQIAGQVVQRGCHTVRRYTPDEDRQLLEMEAAGLRLSEIGRALDRRRNSVLGRLMILARREAWAEEKGGADA